MRSTFLCVIPQVIRDQSELLKCCFEVIDDFLGDDVGVGKVGRIF
jgi:hypothetical protein